MILAFILILKNILVYSPDSLDLIFNFKTCYKSISHPNLYVELFHNLPTGPVYIEILTKYKIDLVKKKNRRTVFYTRHHFKRIGGTCQSSLLFTTKGKRFQKMRLLIRIFHTLDNMVYFSEFIYSFSSGFSLGRYPLLDILSNFGLYVEIRGFGTAYFQKSRYSRERAISYLRSIEWTDKEICVLMDNKEPIVIRPQYYNYPPKGLITQIVADGFRDKDHVSSVVLTAFSCHTEEENLNESVMLFKEITQTETIFFAEYINLENPNIKKHKEFIIPGSKWEDIDNFSYYPESLKKIDISHSKKVEEECCDGSIRFFFISKKGVVFNSREFKLTKVDTGVKKWESTYFHPLAACCA